MSKKSRAQRRANAGAAGENRTPHAWGSGAGITHVYDAPGNRDSAVAQTGSPFLLFGNDGFQSAGNSTSRGYIYFPQLDTRRQLSTFTREEISRRIQWLYNHFGFARRLCNGMARLLGFLTPQPNTSDEEWNELSFEAFMAIAGSAEIYDRGGKFDFFESQVQDNVSIFRDADCLGVLTETQSGRGRIAYYESHQIRNGEQTEKHWVDGVRLDDFGKHIGYNVRDGEDPTQFTPIDARDCIYFANFENRGQVRPLSILATAVLNMIDVVETRGFTKHALKSHSRIGTVVEQDMGMMVANTGGLGGPLLQANMPLPDGGYQTFNYEMVMNGGQQPQLRPGQRVKVVADDRPTPNNMEFEKALLRDCVWGSDLSFEILCDLAGITGPGIRFLNAELKRWIMLRQYRQAKRCNRFFNYAIAKEIKSGRLREPILKKGEFWWNKTEWIGLPAMDIDAGRTASATLIELQSGLTTWLDEWGEMGGVYWKRRIRQAVFEVAYAKLQAALVSKSPEMVKHGITVTAQEVFPQRFAIANQQQATTEPPAAAPKGKTDLSDPADTPEGQD